MNAGADTLKDLSLEGLRISLLNSINQSKSQARPDLRDEEINPTSLWRQELTIRHTGHGWQPFLERDLHSFQELIG